MSRRLREVWIAYKSLLIKGFGEPLLKSGDFGVEEKKGESSLASVSICLVILICGGGFLRG